MAIPRTQPHAGPAILSYGLRPFFLLGAFHSALSILLWLPILMGFLALPTTLTPRDWHIHEMLYGYLPAVIAGYLLASIPNWTGRFPLQGRPLLGLVLVWIAGRLAVSMSAWTGWALAAVIDLGFLALIAAAVGREIVVGRNWQNLKVLAVVAALFIGNLSFHLEAHLASHVEHGARIGVAAIVVLVMLIGGRLVPSFTRNWLARENPGRMPASFGRFDLGSTIVAGLALAIWIAAPEALATGFLLVVAGLLQAFRMARWAGDRTTGESLVLVLHLAYAFIPVGFFLVGLAAFSPAIPASAGIHAWSGGAFGTMTLAVMSRVSLSHGRRVATASPALRLIFALVLVAALARIAAALVPYVAMALLGVATLCWSTAFLGFCAAFWNLLTKPKSGPRASSTLGDRQPAAGARSD
jgi:uncharacterized protein involved in response to NO